MGTTLTIDAPLKVGRFGISSVVSIVDDELCEEMRKFYCEQFHLDYAPINKDDEDRRARRITAYLDVLDDILHSQMQKMIAEPFETQNDICKYFEMLDEQHPLKEKYRKMWSLEGEARLKCQDELRCKIRPGKIEANIMTKIDKDNYSAHNELLPPEFSDACAALRGFGKSKLDSSIIFSAGFNRRLYAYIDQFNDFFPDENGYIKKRIVLKVSDFRSSLTQGKFLAKKGLWVSEHRIESGLNCGGHAFASDGYLLGPILNEFKINREELIIQLSAIVNESLSEKGKPLLSATPEFRITVQGGIGTAKEDKFLRDQFLVNGTGWASPFLLVPEVSTLDDPTRELVRAAKREDFYLSDISPLGVPFNTVRGTASEIQKLERAEVGRPGSPCPKGYLVSDTTYSKKPVCRAAMFFQKREIENLPVDQPHFFKDRFQEIIQKACLCEDLAAPALIVNKIKSLRPQKTAVCPGPNLAYFSKMATLSEMVSHIYGRISLLNETYRPNMFVNELQMYVDYLKKEIKKAMPQPSQKEVKYLSLFKQNLLEGIAFYKELIPKLLEESVKYREKMKEDLMALAEDLDQLITEYAICFSEPTAISSPS